MMDHVPTQSDPCTGPDCAWCKGLEESRQEICGWTGHDWVEYADGLFYCEKCSAEKQEPAA